MLRPPPINSKLRMGDLGHLRSEFVWIYEGPVEHSYRDTQNHFPGQPALLLLDGTALVENEKGVAHVKKGQWCFPSSGPRRQLFSDDTRILSLRFKLYWPGGQPLFDSDVGLVVDAARIPKLETQSRRLYDLVKAHVPGAATNLRSRQGDLQTFFILQKGFSDWLCVYVECMLSLGLTPVRLGHTDNRVLRALHILDDLSLEETFDMQWLASEVALSPSQLDRLFTKQFNLTPRQYFERRKLVVAMEMIRDASFSIKQIAYELGFQSLPYFSRWFRQRIGHSPREYQCMDNPPGIELIRQ